MVVKSRTFEDISSILNYKMKVRTRKFYIQDLALPECVRKELEQEPEQLEFETDRNGVAKLVNPELAPNRWRNNEAWVAYNYLEKLATGEVAIEPNFEVGYQMPKHPRRINYTILYLYCMDAQIYVGEDTKADELERMVRYDLLGSDQDLLRQTERMIKLGFRHQLIELLSRFDLAIPEGKFSISNGLDYFPTHQREPLDDAKFEYQRLHIRPTDLPKNNLAAVMTAAITLEFDLSYAEDPVLEYNLIIVSPSYEPHDLWMNYWYKRNPDLFNLKKTYNPWFPKAYYRHLGIEHNEEEEMMIGASPELVNKVTPIFQQEINEVPDLLRFHFNKRRFVISAEELKLHLTNLISDLRTPFEAGQYFNEGQIKSVLKYFNDPELSAHIERVKTLISSNCEKFTIFSRAFTTANEQTQSLVQLALQNLMDAAMYMRGWSGSGKYPVKHAITTEDFFDQLTVNVTDALNEFDRICDQLSDLDPRLLPLLCYQEHGYIFSHQPEDGKTIGERIQIVRDGSSQSSCIRISSNWLVSSAYRIMEQLKIPLTFDIKKLRYIL